MTPYEGELNIKYQRITYLVVFAITLAIATLAVLVVASTHMYHAKIVNSYGLSLEIIGVVLTSYVIIFPRAKRIYENGPMSLAEHKQPEKLDHEYLNKNIHKVIMGVILVALGFAIQLYSNWIF